MMYSSLIIISWTWVTICTSCDPLYLRKYDSEFSLHQQTEAPRNASNSLHACSRWCFQNPGCQLLSWIPGQCWQVGCLGTLKTNGTVFQLVTVPIGEFFEFPRETIENNKIIGSISGVIFSGVALVTGKMGFALQTNGVDQYVDFGYQGDTCLGYFIRCTHGWVTAFWVRLGYNIGPVFIMDTGMNLRKGQGVVWNPNAQRLTAYLVTESMFLVVSGEATPDQGWIHVVVTWRQCYDAKLYTDGELVATHTGSVLNLPAGPLVPSFVLGASYDNQAKFNGTLDELRVWDTIMSDDEVQAMYTVDAGHK